MVSGVKVALPFLQREISRKDEGRGKMRVIDGEGNRVRGRGSRCRGGKEREGGRAGRRR